MISDDTLSWLEALREALARCEQYGSEAVKLIAREALKEAPDV